MSGGRAPRLSHTSFIRVTNLLHDAAEESSGWNQVAASIGECLRTPANVLTVENAPSGTSQIVVTPDADPNFTQSYNSYYHSVNLLIQRARPILKPGKIMLSSELCGDSELARSEFYNGWMLPQNLFYVIGGQIARTDSTVVVLNCIRAKNAGNFNREETSFLNALVPHFERAARTQEAFAVMRAMHASFDVLGYGLLLVSARGTVEYRNDRARRMIEAKDGLDIWIRSLQVERSAGQEISISRSSGKQAYRSVCLPLHEGLKLWSAQAAVMAILIRDPEEAIVPGSDFWRTCRLTRSEIRLAELLVQGDSLAAACERLSITKNTGRAHLRAIFSKTGVKRQSELVRLAFTSGIARRLLQV